MLCGNWKQKHKHRVSSSVGGNGRGGGGGGGATKSWNQLHLALPFWSGNACDPGQRLRSPKCNKYLNWRMAVAFACSVAAGHYAVCAIVHRFMQISAHILSINNNKLKSTIIVRAARQGVHSQAPKLKTKFLNANCQRPLANGRRPAVSLEMAKCTTTRNSASAVSEIFTIYNALGLR